MAGQAEFSICPVPHALQDAFSIQVGGRPTAERHSLRSATIGSRRDARHAGKYAETVETTTSTPTAVPCATGSEGAVPYNNPPIARAARKASGSPMAPPARTSSSASRTMSHCTAPRSAPSATRTPSSAVRRLTAYDDCPVETEAREAECRRAKRHRQPGKEPLDANRPGDSAVEGFDRPDGKARLRFTQGLPHRVRQCHGIASLGTRMLCRPASILRGMDDRDAADGHGRRRGRLAPAEVIWSWEKFAVFYATKPISTA